MEKEQGQILDANYNLATKILARYGNEGKQEIYLTRSGYQKGLGDGKCWGLLDDTQVEFLVKNNVLDIVKVSPNVHLKGVKFYQGIFDLKQAEKIYISLETSPRRDWGWVDKRKGEYQFGRKIFIQSGKIRKVVFQGMMDLFEKNGRGFNNKSLLEVTNLDPERLSIEVSEINQRLRSEIGYHFPGNGTGYHPLEQVASN